jgi:hypothetical protein
LESEPNSWYYNLGVLEVDKKLTDWSEPADQLETVLNGPGQPVVAVGIPLDELGMESLNDFYADKRYMPKAILGTVFYATTPEISGTDRSIVYMTGPFPENFEGSPIFDGRTKRLIAICMPDRQGRALPRFIRRVPGLDAPQIADDRPTWVDVDETFPNDSAKNVNEQKLKPEKQTDQSDTNKEKNKIEQSS